MASTAELHPAGMLFFSGASDQFRPASTTTALGRYIIGIGDGSETTFEDATISAISAVYRTDWQGVQALYATARTNLGTQSESVGSWANHSGATTNSDVLASPYDIWVGSGTNADKLIETATTGPHQAYTDYGSSLDIGLPFTFSMHAKAGGRSIIALVFSGGGGAWSASKTVYFNLVAGTYSVKTANTTATMIDLGNGWYRCAIHATTDAVGTVRPIVYMAESDGVTSYAGDIAKGVYFWGKDLKQSLTLSPYIGPTTTTPVTVTDYALTGSEVEMAVAPLADAIVSVDGTATATGTATASDSASLNGDQADTVTGFPVAMGDGVNSVFTIHPAITTITKIYKAGVELTETTDYTLAGNVLTMVAVPALYAEISLDGVATGLPLFWPMD